MPPLPRSRRLNFDTALSINEIVAVRRTHTPRAHRHMWLPRAQQHEQLCEEADGAFSARLSRSFEEFYQFLKYVDNFRLRGGR